MNGPLCIQLISCLTCLVSVLLSSIPTCSTVILIGQASNNGMPTSNTTHLLALSSALKCLSYLYIELEYLDYILGKYCYPQPNHPNPPNYMTPCSRFFSIWSIFSLFRLDTMMLQGEIFHLLFNRRLSVCLSLSLLDEYSWIFGYGHWKYRRHKSNDV